MSLAQEIKNYIYFQQHFIEQPTNIESFINYIKYNLAYILKLLQENILYFISFDWIHDFSELGNTLPVYSSSSLQQTYTTLNPNHFLLEYNSDFSPISTSILAIFISAFIMSFYFWLPNSIIQILIIRRLLVEGIPAGLAAALGTLTAQVLSIVILLFGFRFSLFAWLNFEPLNYIIGIIITFILVYQLTHSPIKRQRFSNYAILGQIFVINFILIAFENYGLFPYLDSFCLIENLNFLALTQSSQKLSYLFSFILSSGFWILVFGYSYLTISQIIVTKITKSYSNWVQKINFSCLTLIIAYCIASLPYYGLDYLVFAPFGLYSEEPSVFTLQTNKKDVSKGRLGEYSAHSSVDTDVTPYDRGRYATGSEIELTFEDLNFQGEYIWRSRADRLASGSAGIVNKYMSKFLPKNTREYPDANVSTEITNTESIQPQLIYENDSIFESLYNRFISDYMAEVKDETLPDNTLEFEQFSAFSELVKYGFDSFASLEDVESDEFEEELGKKIKYKYYNNPIYKFILQCDITNFLNRQPKEYSLTSDEEIRLFKQKQILMHYYNSLKEYTLLPYAKIFKDLFGETKSYANRVYNQQYKGTLKILRRLFLIDLNSNELKATLKYDQILVDDKIPIETSFHEELNTSTKKIRKKLKYIREVSNRPFYLGWDDESKYLSISNRYFSHQTLFDTIQLDKNLKINFTSWPYIINSENSKFMFQKFDQAQTDLQKDLFEYTEIGDYESRLIYETLPSIIKRIDLRNKDKTLISLKPNYGIHFQFLDKRG